MNLSKLRDTARNLNWVNAVWLIGSPIAAAALTIVHFRVYGFHPWLLLPLLITGTLTNLSITCGYHRLLSHRAYEARPEMRLLYLLFGAAAFEGSALQWASDHRRHHRFVDTENDPYSIQKGFFYAHMGWLFKKEDPRFLQNYPTDLTRDPIVQWQHRHYVLLAFSVGLIFPTLVGWYFGNALAGLVYGGLLRVVLCQHSTFLINSACHFVGTQPYHLKTSARDSLIMAVLATGEGYHNFHHRFQSDYRNGIRWYHWDPGKWMIRFFSLFGWTYRLKTIPEPLILSARMQTDHHRLLAHGAPPERLTALKLKVEEAQIRWRSLYEDYTRLKFNMREQSRQKLLDLKAELRVARLEFKMSCAQWGAYMRTFKARRAMPSHVAGL